MEAFVVIETLQTIPQRENNQEQQTSIDCTVAIATQEALGTVQKRAGCVRTGNQSMLHMPTNFSCIALRN